MLYFKICGYGQSVRRRHTTYEFLYDESEYDQVKMALKQDSEFSRHLRKEATKALDTVLAFGLTLEDTLEKSEKDLGARISG